MSKEQQTVNENDITLSFEQSADLAAKRWPSLIETFVGDSVLAKTRGVFVEDVAALGEMLGQWEKYQNFCEAQGTLADLGTLPKHALEIITADFGTSIVPHVASVQPIKERLGIIYFKTVKTTKQRGNMDVGDYMQHPFYPPHDAAGDDADIESLDTLRYPEGYAGEKVIVALTVGDADDSQQTFAVDDASEISSSIVPAGAYVRPRSVVLTGTYTPAESSEVVTVKAIDDGEGSLLGNGITGTVRYIPTDAAGEDTGRAGITSIAFAYPPKVATTPTFTLEYATDFEESGYVPEVNFTVEYTDIAAEIFALTQSTGMFKAFEFSNRFGQSAEEMVARDLTGALNLEIGNAAISRLVAAAESIPYNTVTFNAGVPQFISYAEHMQQLKAVIVKASSTILRHAGRGMVNYLICGANAAAIIATLPGWTQQIVDTPGSNIWGTLDGMTVIRAPHIDPNTIYCVYKGKGGFDTPLVYSPYMPLVVTKTLQDIDNILKNRALAAVWAGLKVVAPTFVTKIVIDNATYVTPILQP